MNLDWEKLTEGFREELEKSGSINYGAVAKKVVAPALVGGGILAGGSSLLGSASNGLGEIGEIAKAVAPIGLAALMGMSGGKSNKGNAARRTYLPSHEKPSFLTPDPGTVSSISSPRAYASPIKQADLVDSFGDAVNRRIANSVLNQVTKTNALGFAINDPARAASAKQPKELELVAKYPELENLLKDEANKAYLKKLLES
jgi:hypothetical protein